MGAEIDGDIKANDYKLKKLSQSLRQRDAQLKALQSHLEETQRAAEKKIEELQSKIEELRGSVAHWKKRYQSKLQPRVETKASAQGVRASVGEDPVSPPIST